MSAEFQLDLAPVGEARVAAAPGVGHCYSLGPNGGYGIGISRTHSDTREVIRR